MSMLDNDVIWEKERDPLEINEEIDIKYEDIEEIEPKIIDLESFHEGSNNFDDIPIISLPNFNGIQKIVNIDSLLKNSNQIIDECTYLGTPNTNITSACTIGSNDLDDIPIISVSDFNGIPKIVNIDSLLKSSNNTTDECATVKRPTRCKKKTSAYTERSNDSDDIPTIIASNFNGIAKIINIDSLLNNTNQITDECTSVGAPTTNKKTRFTCNTESSNDSDVIPIITAPNFNGTKKEVEIIKSIKRKSNNVTDKRKSVPTPTTSNKTPSAENTAHDKTTKKDTSCNCMRYVEYYCTTCEKSLFYSRNKTQCRVCKTLLRLQCRRCRKRFKFLSSVHQYVLQFSKRENLLSKTNKYITFTCKKEQYFCCSKCSYKTTQKELFSNHIKSRHLDYANDTARLDKLIQIYCRNCKSARQDPVYNNYLGPCKTCKKSVTYRCAVCFIDYRILKHMRSHVDNNCSLGKMNNFRCYSCLHCSYKGSVKSHLEIHMREHHMPKVCFHCTKECKDKAALDRHIVEECIALRQNNEPVTNKRTRRSSKVTNYLKRSRRVPDSDESYEIVKNNPETLIEGIDRVKSTIPKWKSFIDYYCLHCHNVGKNKFSHIKPQCPNCKLPYEYRCTKCKKLYAGHTGIIGHVNREDCSLPMLKCSVCNYTSIRKYLLVNHIKCKHTIYMCLRCNCKCEGYLSLRKHQSFYCTIENPHSTIHIRKLIALYCTACSIRSIKFDGTGLVPCKRCTTVMSYQCLKCNQIFDDQDVAYKHVKENCKPSFHCDKCHYKAYNKVNLDVHIKYMHTNRKCPDCGLHFKDEHHFRKHRVEEIYKRKTQKLA